MRVIAPIPTSPIFSCRTNRAMAASSMGCALPSISTTSCPGGVSAFSRNIQRCGIKLRVTPLSGLYSKILMLPLSCFLPCAFLLTYKRGPDGAVEGRIRSQQQLHCVGMQRARCNEVYDGTVGDIGCNTGVWD